MTPNQRASQAVRSYLDIHSTLSLSEWIAQAIKDAENDKLNAVLSLLNEHKQCESCVVIDELEEQIKQQMTDP